MQIQDVKHEVYKYKYKPILYIIIPYLHNIVKVQKPINSYIEKKKIIFKNDFN